MKHVTLLLMLVFLCTLPSFGQGEGSKWQKHTPPLKMDVPCQTCHACPKPTKTDPCLVKCPRMHIIPGYHPEQMGPDVLRMDDMTDQYGPVIFAHRMHAEMSEMSGGCYSCHHYNSTSMAILSCRECHPKSRARTDISMPDLKGAYHRQCMDCHRQWTHSTDCNGCHIKKEPGQTDAAALRAQEIAGKKHPNVTRPTKVVFETRNEHGSFVTFFHDDHATRFGLKCADCHQQDGCVRCHDAAKPVSADPQNRQERTQRPMEQLHQPCFSCHAQDKCESCHVAEPMKAFDHARSAGWALNRFHREISCQKCHGLNKRFTKVDTACKTCHKGWSPGAFKHEVTGLRLDANHSTLDCESCHVDMDFGKPPSCAGCHDDKSYPMQRPGKMITAVPGTSPN
jgi:hypothetical protein